MLDEKVLKKIEKKKQQRLLALKNAKTQEEKMAWWKDIFDSIDNSFRSIKKTQSKMATKDDYKKIIDKLNLITKRREESSKKTREILEIDDEEMERIMNLPEYKVIKKT